VDNRRVAGDLIYAREQDLFARKSSTASYLLCTSLNNSDSLTNMFTNIPQKCTLDLSATLSPAFNLLLVDPVLQVYFKIIRRQLWAGTIEFAGAVVAFNARKVLVFDIGCRWLLVWFYGHVG
jgi:hypothetical protein